MPSVRCLFLPFSCPSPPKRVWGARQTHFRCWLSP
jgi:hypothetical protein